MKPPPARTEDRRRQVPSVRALQVVSTEGGRLLRYLKAVRLHKARMLMVQEGVHVGEAAEQVGYESASQFSREFKRLFGRNPSEEAAHVRHGLTSSKPVIPAAAVTPGCPG